MSAPRAVVCYDEARPGMYLRIEGQDIASFMASAAWRAWLYYPASAVDGTDRDRILLDGGMGLRECQDMLEAIMEADGHGVEVAVDPSFGAFVNAGETYIRERSEVGLAIKAQTAEGIADDPSLGPRFREFRDVVNASMVRPLRDRQMLDAFFMATVGRAADFSVPGAGKTATVLGVFAYLRHLGLARRIVVVCPKNGFESWEKEWVATFGDKLPLSCFSLGDPAIAAMSTERRRNALSLDSGACNLFTFNYESLSGYVRELHAIIPDQTLLVFDEVHRVKAIGGRRAEAALEAADGAKFVIALTGTPIPNTYQDIYNLLHILYPEDYDTFFGYEPGELRAPMRTSRQASTTAWRPSSAERTRTSSACRARSPTRSWRSRRRPMRTHCCESCTRLAPTRSRGSYAPCSSRATPRCSALQWTQATSSTCSTRSAMTTRISTTSTSRRRSTRPSSEAARARSSWRASGSWSASSPKAAPS